MAIPPQNFVDKVGPAVSAAFLNGLDATVNQGLNGLTTPGQIAALLGVVSPVSLPLAVNQGGTGATDGADALTALGGTTYAAVTIPRTTAEIHASVTPTDYRWPELHPFRYGAVGDGVTDDTAALNILLSVVNGYTAARPGVYPTSTWPSGSTFLCGPLTPITAKNFTWNMYSSILVKANSWSTTGTPYSYHIQVNGVGCAIAGLTLDGNKAAFTATPYAYCLYFAPGANNPLLYGLTIKNSAGGALLMDTVVGGRIAQSKFDSHCGVGISLFGCSYLDFVNVTCNLDGYPFGTTVVPGVPVPGDGFGVVIRYRTHHCTFTASQAQQACADGMNVNQGSYAIKFNSCLAWMNGDGGFTIAADATGTGRPGESESPYDLEYNGCESYNNWGSGLVAFVPVYNVTVDGGRYYDNHRLAGAQAEASSYFSGLFFAGGSLGIRVRTKSYDDRQLCGITNTPGGGGVIAATGWVAGTMGNYPRVAVYNAALVFQGYGNIVAESAGSVTISSSTYEGITLANIVPGWFVSQRVQHNGCMFDNNVQGTMDVDGFGFLQGYYVGLTPYKMWSGDTMPGQNALLPALPLDYTELIANPTFDTNVTGWTVANAGAGTGATFTQTTTTNLVKSPGAGQLYGGTAGANCDGNLITSSANYVGNNFVELSVMVNATNAGDASITLYWNSATINTTVVHPGGGWARLVIGGFISAGYGALGVRLVAAAGKSPTFDNLYLRTKQQTIDSRDTYYPTRNLPV